MGSRLAAVLGRRRAAYALVSLVAAGPRLLVVAFRHQEILGSYTDKSDDFARTLVESGTYGFIPGEPSAYTQPLYGFFLAPIYQLFGPSGIAVGLAQTAVAVATALVVYELGRLAVSHRAGLGAALVSTLHPYLVWHDIHVNREIIDGLAAAAVAYLAYRASARLTPMRVAALGIALGLAVLGNARLVFLPIVVLGAVAWLAGPGRRSLALAAVGLAICAAVLAPWVIRNKVEVGCYAITTDAKALWKANNEQTYGLLARGLWIDNVPNLPDAPLTPEMTGAIYKQSGKVIHLDECAQMRFYRHLVIEFWKEHPGEKAKLAAQASMMLWSPRVTLTEGRPGQGTRIDTARAWAMPAYVVALYALALLGARLLPRRLLWLTAVLLAYQTLAAVIFAGATRYRVPWDFLLAVPAGAALVRLAERVRR